MVEPLRDTYLPFLKPLLDAPGSRYSYRDWDDDVRWQPSRYAKEGLIPDLRGLEDAASKATGPNNSLLIVANMSSSLGNQRPRHGYGHDSHFQIMEFTNSLRSESGFHAHGPVRMLMWLTDVEKQAIVPRTIHHRRKLSLHLEMTSHVEEIVGGVPSRQKLQQREDFLDLESSKKVAKRMLKESIQIPSDRQDGTQKLIENISSDTDRYIGPGGIHSDVSREWHKDLQTLERDFDEGKFPQFIGGQPSIVEKARRWKDPRTYTPEFVKMVTMQRTFKAQQKKKNEVEVLLQEQAEIDSLELNAYREGLDDMQRRANWEILNRRTQEFKARMSIISSSRAAQFEFLVDDRRAFAREPPLLLWDRRTAEPMIARAEEFYTPKQLALLDFQPYFPNPFPMTGQQTAYFDRVMTSLFSHASQSPTSLKHLAPGAVETVIPRVPALQDPRKGGRRDLDELRVRCMTPEMAHGLAIAWTNWAFKPSLTSMMNDFSHNSPSSTESTTPFQRRHRIL